MFGTAQGREQKLLGWKKVPQENKAASKTQTTVCLWLSPWTTKVGKNAKHGKRPVGTTHRAGAGREWGAHTHKKEEDFPSFLGYFKGYL